MTVVVAVDIGARATKAVAAVMYDDGARVKLLRFIVGTGDRRSFAEEVVRAAAEASATIVVESQFIRYPAAAIALIESRMWVKVLASLAGLGYEEALPASWQSVMLRAARTPKKKGNTKQRAAEAARRMWPCMEMSEDQADAALIGLWWLRFRGPPRSPSPPARRSRSSPKR